MICCVVEGESVELVDTLIETDDENVLDIDDVAEEEAVADAESDCPTATVSTQRRSDTRSSTIDADGARVRAQ